MFSDVTYELYLENQLIWVYSILYTHLSVMYVMFQCTFHILCVQYTRYYID